MRNRQRTLEAANLGVIQDPAELSMFILCPGISNQIYWVSPHFLAQAGGSQRLFYFLPNQWMSLNRRGWDSYLAVASQCLVWDNLNMLHAPHSHCPVSLLHHYILHHLLDYYTFWGGRRWGCNELTCPALLWFMSWSLHSVPCFVYSVQRVYRVCTRGSFARVTHLVPVLSFLLAVNQWTRALSCSRKV